MDKELELIQTIAHLLQKAGEAETEVAVSGWAVENTGKIILASACEVREALDKEKGK